MLAFLASPDMRNIAVRADGQLSPGATNSYKKPGGGKAETARFSPRFAAILVHFARFR